MNKIIDGTYTYFGQSTQEEIERIDKKKSEEITFLKEQLKKYQN